MNTQPTTFCNLQGKTAFITGAGRNIGAGIAKALGQQGATIIINDIVASRADDAVSQLQKQGIDASAKVFNICQLEETQAALKGLKIDILVNNAGNAGDNPQGTNTMQQNHFVDMAPDEWQRFIDINLMGVLNCTSAVLPGMYERQFGRILVISSEAGRVGLDIGVSIYGAAKAASVSFTRHLAKETGRQGITANSLSLGLMNNVPEEFTAQFVKGIPVGRLGTPEDIGALTTFLASEEASWITGQNFAINGGVHTNT